MYADSTSWRILLKRGKNSQIVTPDKVSRNTTKKSPKCLTTKKISGDSSGENILTCKCV